MPPAEVPGIFPELIISPYSDRVPRISMFMKAAHWICIAQSGGMMRRHNADSGFCYTAPNLNIGDALFDVLVDVLVDVLDVSLKFVSPVRVVACQCRVIAD